jgi:hypothetical protein
MISVGVAFFLGVAFGFLLAAFFYGCDGSWE